MASYRVFVVAAVGDLGPGIIEIEDGWRELRAGGIAAERVVDAEEELLFGESVRTSGGAIVGKIACEFVFNLCCEDLSFKTEDLLNLVGSGNGPLRVAGGGIAGLLGKVVVDWLKSAIEIFESFAAIPHDGAEERNVG